MSLEIELPYRSPYDWEAMLAFLRARAIPGVERVSDTRYVRSIELDEAQGLIAVEPSASHALHVRVECPHRSVLPTIVDRIGRVFDLRADPAVIDEHLATDPLLAPLIATRPGLRVPGAWDGFELAIRAILGQQITLRAAVGLAAKLVASHGERLAPQEGADGITHVFPSARRIVSADLTTLGMPRARAAALSSLARAVVNDPGVLEAGRSLDERVTRLQSLPGVGEWTAQYIALRELREPDAFPAGDVALQRALAQLEGRTVSRRDLLARAERWRPWRAYAAQHLWSVAATMSARAATSR